MNYQQERRLRSARQELKRSCREYTRRDRMRHRQHDSFGLWLLIVAGLAMLARALATAVGSVSLQVWDIF